MKAPSFKGLHPSSPGSSRAKQANRPRDTGPELALRRALLRLNLRFRTYPGDLPGRPDIVMRGLKIAVFCDGDFWHGRHWPILKRALRRRANSTYWIAKIKSNEQRDKVSRRKLRRLGWFVVSLWEGDILRDPERAALMVKSMVDSRTKALASLRCAQGRARARNGRTP